MDQVAGIQSQRKIIDVARGGLAKDGDTRFAEILRWLAYAHQTAPGYPKTWAPDEVDLISTLGDYECDDDFGKRGPNR